MANACSATTGVQMPDEFEMGMPEGAPYLRSASHPAVTRWSHSRRWPRVFMAAASSAV